MTVSMFLHEILYSNLFNPNSREEIRENLVFTEEGGFKTTFGFGIRVEFCTEKWEISLNGFKGEGSSLAIANEALIKDAENYYK